MFWYVNPGLGKIPAFSPNWPGMYWPFCWAASGSAPAMTAQRIISGQILSPMGPLFPTYLAEQPVLRPLSREPNCPVLRTQSGPILAAASIVGDPTSKWLTTTFLLWTHSWFSEALGNASAGCVEQNPQQHQVCRKKRKKRRASHKKQKFTHKIALLKKNIE